MQKFLCISLKNAQISAIVIIFLCRERDKDMKTVFMVAEKPSLAQSLAKILSNGQMSTRKGSNGACSIHKYTGRFPQTGEQVRFKFTSVCGHVMTLDFIGKYNNWDKVDPVSCSRDIYKCLWL